MMSDCFNKWFVLIGREYKVSKQTLCSRLLYNFPSTEAFTCLSCIECRLQCAFLQRRTPLLCTDTSFLANYNFEIIKGIKNEFEKSESMKQMTIDIQVQLYYFYKKLKYDENKLSFNFKLA